MKRMRYLELKALAPPLQDPRRVPENCSVCRMTSARSFAISNVMSLTLHAMQRSANCYKVRLLLAHLSMPFVLKDVDILRGDTRTPQFLAMNPRGRVPVLQLGNGTVLIESNAILMYLGEGTRFVPTDKVERAVMMQWLFFEQNSHHPSIGEARFWMSLIPAAAS